MQQSSNPTGSDEWLKRFTLESFRSIERAIGELTGKVESNHSATNQRIDDFKDEAVNRLIRLEERVWKAERRRTGVLLSILKDWRHLVPIATLLILGVLGHLTKADLVAWLIGAKP